MATRMNMLKLLQEVRGHALFPNARPDPRPPGALLLRFPGHHLRTVNPPLKKVLRIQMHEPVDIPQPVVITHVSRFSRRDIREGPTVSTVR